MNDGKLRVAVSEPDDPSVPPHFLIRVLRLELECSYIARQRLVGRA